IEITKFLTLLLKINKVAELRIVGTSKGTISGYFNNAEDMAGIADAWNGKVPAIYTTLNPVLPDLLARKHNRVEPYVKVTTKDDEIACRLWLPMDFDPVRPSGISRTNEEHE